MKRVLVTGGAGYIGHSLTRDLIDAGARVRRLFRASSRRPALEHPNVEDVTGDVTVRGDLERACAGVDETAAVASALITNGPPAA